MPGTLQPSAMAPDFALPNQDTVLVSLSALRGLWVVAYWYPRADTPGCTAQAQGFRDQLPAYADLGCTILGISFDPPAVTKAFRSKYRLGFDLLSDIDHEVSIAYGVAPTAATVPSRTSFLISPAGRIQKVYEVQDPAFHAEDVLDDLEEYVLGGAGITSGPDSSPT